jgi:hypothetical protein
MYIVQRCTMLKEQPKMDSAPSPRTTNKREALGNVPSENIKLSSEAVSFRNLKAGHQPCLSFMPGVSSRVPRIEMAEQGQEEDTRINRVSVKVGKPETKLCEADQYMVREFITTVRRDAIWALNFLLRFDGDIDIAGSQILCSAVNVVDRVKEASS